MRYNSIQLVFNLPIDATTVTPERFTILKDGIAQSGILAVTSTNSQTFDLSGLSSFMEEDGDYELVIDLPNIQTTAEVAGLATQAITLTLDTQAPILTNMVQLSEGALDEQH